jgi:predicted exporter
MLSVRSFQWFALLLAAAVGADYKTWFKVPNTELHPQALPPTTPSSEALAQMSHAINRKMGLFQKESFLQHVKNIINNQ